MLIPTVHRVVHQTGEENWLSIEHRSVAVDSGQKLYFTLVLTLKNNQTELQLSSLARSIVQVFETKLSRLYEHTENDEGNIEQLIRKTITTLQQEQVDLDIVVAIQSGFNVFLGATNGIVGIKRGQQYGQILQAFGELITARGQLVDGDILVLGSEVFTKFIAYKDVKTVLQNTDMESVTTKLNQLVSTSPITAGAALITHATEVVVSSPQTAATPEPPTSRDVYFHKPQETSVGLKDFRAEKKKKTIALVIVIILLLVLVGSIGWRWQQQKRQAESERVAQLLTPIAQLVSLAEDQQGINPLQARAYLFEAKSKIEQLQAETVPEAKERAEIDTLAGQIKTEYARLSGEKDVTPELFFDLNLTKDGFSISKLSIDETELFALDSSSGTVVWLDTGSKQSEIRGSGGSLTGAKLLSNTQDEVFVYTEAGVFSVGDGTTEEIAPRQDEWQSVGGFSRFANRLYILDTVQGEIWRYQVEQDSVNRQRWLAPGVTPEFVDVSDMVIDGDIWVLDKNGQVRQYTQGVSQGFSIQGLDVAMTDAVAITPTEENVYVLDRSKNRIVKFNRNGVYQEQFLWPELAQANDMVGIESGLLLSVGSKLFLFPY